MTFQEVDTIFTLLPFGLCGVLAVVMAWVCFVAYSKTKSFLLKLTYIPLMFAFQWTATLYLLLSLITLSDTTLATICGLMKSLAG